MSKHVHAEIIKAWGEGKTIQVYDNSIGSWVIDKSPYFSPNLEYRIVDPIGASGQRSSYVDTWATMNDQQNKPSNSFEFTLRPSLEEICAYSVNELKNTITVYEQVKLIKFKDDYHIGSDDSRVNNVKYTFDANTFGLVKVEMIKCK